MNSLQALPRDIINIILEFQGYHVFRHGKYMIQIDKNDPRYELLLKKPLIKKNRYGYWQASIHETIYDRCYTYTITTYEHAGFIHWTFNVYHSDNHDCNYVEEEEYHTYFYNSYYSKKSRQYVFGRHPKQNLPNYNLHYLDF